MAGGPVRTRGPVMCVPPVGNVVRDEHMASGRTHGRPAGRPVRTRGPIVCVPAVVTVGHVVCDGHMASGRTHGRRAG
eukprot:3600362-Prymnesium_polylepis.1